MKRLIVVAIVMVGALASSFLVRHVVEAHQETVEIVQWSNSHPMRKGLLPDMAKAFNREHHKTAAGQIIKVVVLQCDSKQQTEDLVSRVTGGGPASDGCGKKDSPAPEPTIVTPQSDDWLTEINHRARSDVIDIPATRSIAETWLGIVTYRDMAKCLGWPDKQLGYGDILELRADPKGWGSRDCASAAWGTTPLLAFTNPSQSTSGRNVLVSLYAIAAHKAPADLTVADIDRPEVLKYVKQFQEAVDHYMPTTLALNTKITQGQKFGHFFLMPEDNLVSLYQGTADAIDENGTPRPAKDIHDLVMVYPHEGSVLNANPAGVVHAPWVTTEQSAAADIWINYLRSEDQQKVFGSAGFRPPHDTGFSVDAQQFRDWGLEPSPPTATIDPGDLQPDVLERILGRWGAVKSPAIVTIVADVSGSMEGARLEQVKDGLNHLLDTLSGPSNAGNTDQVGLITFSDTFDVIVRPRSLSESRLEIADFVQAMEAGGGTALYDAIAKGIQVTDEAAGAEGTKRILVVLSDGHANRGQCLSTIVSMKSADESDVSFCGKEGDKEPPGVHGDALTIEHHNDIQVFFVGFGESDIAVGRILAEATGAEYRATTDDELTTVIEQLSGYV